MSNPKLGIPERLPGRARGGCGWRVGIVFVALLVLLVCGIAIFFLTRGPTYTLPNVTIIDPSDGAQLTTNQLVPVITNASSPNKVTKQELWVDSRLVYVTTARDPQGQERFPTTLMWTPQTGSHALVARALDARGNTGTSSVVRVNVIVSAAPPVQNFIQIAQPGDTLASIGKENGVTPEKMREANPSLPEQPAPGEWVNVPPGDRREGGNDDQPGGAVNDPGAAPLPGDLPGGLANPNPGFLGFGPPLRFWGLINPIIFPPVAPDLNVVANPNCTVTLRWRDNSNNESGFYVYRLVAGATRYTRVEPSFAANNGNNTLTYTDRGVFGHLDYYVAAFNDAGEAASRFVGIDLPANCMRNLIGQMLEVEAESLTAPGYEEMYCYAALKGHRPFERVPMEPGKYLRWMSSPQVPNRPEFIGKWNLQEYYGGPNKRIVAAPEGGQPFRVEVECWGARMTNEGGESFSLGSFDQSHPPAEWDGRALTGRGNSFTLVYHIRPWSGPSGDPNAPVDPDIPAPYGLRRVRDVNDCVAHVPATALLACALANYTDHPPLVWEWDGIPEQIDGYRIYLNRSPVGGTFVPIVDDWPKDVRFWPGPSGIPCGETWRYAITAYNSAGNIVVAESPRSEFIALSGEECNDLALVEVELVSLTAGWLDDGRSSDGLEDTTMDTYGGVDIRFGKEGVVRDRQGVSLADSTFPVEIRSNRLIQWADLPLCFWVDHDLTWDYYPPCRALGRDQNKMVFLLHGGEYMWAAIRLNDDDVGNPAEIVTEMLGYRASDDFWCGIDLSILAMSLDEWAQVDQTLEGEDPNGYYGDCSVRVRVRGLGRASGSRVLAPGGGGPALTAKNANLRVVNIDRNRQGNARITLYNYGPDTLINDAVTLSFQLARVESGVGGNPTTISEHEERALLTIPAFGQTTIDTGQVLLEGFENRVRVVLTAVNFTDPDLRNNAGCAVIDVPDAAHVTIRECAR